MRRKAMLYFLTVAALIIFPLLATTTLPQQQGRPQKDPGGSGNGGDVLQMRVFEDRKLHPEIPSWPPVKIDTVQPDPGQGSDRIPPFEPKPKGKRQTIPGPSADDTPKAEPKKE